MSTSPVEFMDRLATFGFNPNLSPNFKLDWEGEGGLEPPGQLEPLAVPLGQLALQVPVQLLNLRGVCLTGARDKCTLGHFGARGSHTDKLRVRVYFCKIVLIPRFVPDSNGH